MAFRHLGGAQQKALPGQVLLVVRESPIATFLSSTKLSDQSIYSVRQKGTIVEIIC